MRFTPLPKRDRIATASTEAHLQCTKGTGNLVNLTTTVHFYLRYILNCIHQNTRDYAFRSIPRNPSAETKLGCLSETLLSEESMLLGQISIRWNYDGESIH